MRSCVSSRRHLSLNAGMCGSALRSFEGVLRSFAGVRTGVTTGFVREIVDGVVILFRDLNDTVAAEGGVAEGEGATTAAGP